MTGDCRRDRRESLCTHPPALIADLSGFGFGVDEIAYRKGRKFLTIVTEHDTGHVVWVREGRTQTALIAFLDTLGPVRERIQAISMDMNHIYREAARIHLPQMAICYGQFHLIKWVGRTFCWHVGRRPPASPAFRTRDLNGSSGREAAAGRRERRLPGGRP